MKTPVLLATLFAGGVFGYWFATVRKATTLPPAPQPVAIGEPYPVLVPALSPPFAQRLPPGSADAVMLEKLLLQAKTAPQTIDHNAMALLASRLAADGYAVDAARVQNALASLPPLTPPQPPAQQAGA